MLSVFTLKDISCEMRIETSICEDAELAII
jgi:hypothetical protein